eukprot:10412638-Ditylum_brightwellii.AAC.1
MHIGRNGGPSKTEAVIFAAPDSENCSLQAHKALQAMMPNVFCNPTILLHVKHMLYMAIPMNLLLWGCEMWALKQTDWKLLQVFHMSAICQILNISMFEVQEKRIYNKNLYSMFNIDLLESIVTSRHLRWIGKIALMKESWLPRKFLTAWHPNVRPVGRPLTTICHTYLHALWLVGAILEFDDDRKLNDWMPGIREDPSVWERKRLELTSRIIGYVSPIE